MGEKSPKDTQLHILPSGYFLHFKVQTKLESLAAGFQSDLS